MLEGSASSSITSAHKRDYNKVLPIWMQFFLDPALVLLGSTPETCPKWIDEWEKITLRDSCAGNTSIKFPSLLLWMRLKLSSNGTFAELVSSRASVISCHTDKNVVQYWMIEYFFVAFPQYVYYAWISCYLSPFEVVRVFEARDSWT